METAHPLEWPKCAQPKTSFEVASTTSPPVRCTVRVSGDSLNPPKRIAKFDSLKLCAQLLPGVAIACSTAAFGQTVQTTMSVFTERVQWIAAFERMPRASRQAFFLRCDAASREHLLALDDAVRCAMAWDALLKQDFNGDVNGLLAWWREHRDLQPMP